MTRPDYVYVVAIAKPPEEVWKGLTTPEFTRQYWHKTDVSSDFKVGSRIEFLTEDGHIGCEGEILSADYPAELSFTWQFPRNPETSRELPSRVTFRLEPIATGHLWLEDATGIRRGRGFQRGARLVRRHSLRQSGIP